MSNKRMRYLPGLPTMSLGHGAAGYSMPDKLAAIAEIGFVGAEIFYGCLEGYAKELTGSTSRDSLRKAASKTADLCKQHSLTIIDFQPILNYEGIRDPKEHQERLEEISFRMELAEILGTDLMQMASSFLPESQRSHDHADIVRDLQELADMGFKRNPPIRLAYEAMCWSDPNCTWQDSWKLTQDVDRPNFGIVFDAFHVAGYEYADPTIPGCLRENGPERVAQSLAQLKKLDLSKVFFVQLADAEKLSVPLVEGKSPYYHPDQPARMSWSRNCRLFPYEEDRGGFMPIEQIIKAIFDLGYEGFVSFELFTRFMSEQHENLPRQHAQRAKACWETLSARLNLQ